MCWWPSNLLLLLQLDKTGHKSGKKILDKYQPRNIFNALDKMVSASICSLPNMFLVRKDITHSRRRFCKNASEKCKPTEHRNFTQLHGEDYWSRKHLFTDRPTETGEARQAPLLAANDMLPHADVSVSSLFSARLSPANLLSHLKHKTN